MASRGRRESDDRAWHHAASSGRRGRPGAGIRMCCTGYRTGRRRRAPRTGKLDPAHATVDQARQHITAWFDRARSTGTPREAVEDRALHEPRLLDELSRRPHLAGLATSPTMCDALCRLHLMHPGALANRRADLYNDLALRLTAPHTSQGRAGPDAPAPPPPGPLGRWRLYEALAHRMLRQDTLTLDRPEMLEAVAATLPSLPPTDSCGPEQACRALLSRDRILQPDGDADTVTFTHPTLRDHFGAKAIIHGGDPAPLIANAHRDDWAEVIQLTATGGHQALCTRLLAELIRRADAEPEHRTHLDTLASHCLDQLRCRLDPDLVTAVRRRVSREPDSGEAGERS